jgi:probable phosphoglycerate mutase
VVPGPDGHPGETPEEVGDRADRVLARVDAAFANGEGGDVVLVAHAHFLRVLTARRLGLPPADGALFQLATGTVSRLGLEHGRHVLTAWNRLP